MKNLKSHFVFNRSQQNGIFLLAVIIIILQAVYWFVEFHPAEQKATGELEELVRFQQQIDSAKTAGAIADTVRLYPFNPNFITDYKGYTLGMSIEEIDRLHIYRAEEKWVNSAEDFQKVTNVSDSLLKVIAPYFRFPDWVSSGRSQRATQARSASPEASIVKKDFNRATIEDLVAVKGIGETLAGRIINYRSKIGGFVSDLQLKDIYGLSFEVRAEVLANFTVIEPAPIQQFDINKATVLELTTVPYFNYELAREIVNYRLLHESISSFEELAKIKDFPSEKIDRIALYLTLK